MEFIEDKPEENVISQLQMDEVKRRIEYYDKNPHELVSWDEVLKRLKLAMPLTIIP